MDRLFSKKSDVFLHWIMSAEGGFLGTYAILTHNGTFGSAETGNMMELAVEVSSLELGAVGVRLLAFVVFGAAIVAAYLLSNYTSLPMRRLAILVDAAGLTATAFLPGNIDPIAGLCPIFFCAAFQWGVYSGAEGYNSASIFITNNYKQLLLAWTQFFIQKDRKLMAKALLYSVTVAAFFAGACGGYFSVCRWGRSGAFAGLLPLLAAWISLSLRGIPFTRGSRQDPSHFRQAQGNTRWPFGTGKA